MSNFCKPEKGKEVLFLSNGSIEFGYYYLLLLSVLKTEFLFDLYNLSNLKKKRGKMCFFGKKNQYLHKLEKSQRF